VKTTTYGKCWQNAIYGSFLFVCFFIANQEVSCAAPADFPKKEIIITVNYGPGGGRDIMARGVGKVMSKYLGVPVIIMNQPGAGGARGLINLFNAPPDGYTIGVGSGSDITNQIFEKQQQYDNRKFTYIGRIQSSPNMWFVKAESPFRSLNDFRTFGKPIRHSTFSMVANHSVVAMIIANREKWPLVVMGGYKSSSDAILAVLRGDAEFCGLVPSSATPFVRAGQIRPILTVDQKRFPDFPDTPTASEAGHPDMGIFSTDFWFIAPPGVPKVRSKVLEEALSKTIKDPDFVKWAKIAGVDIKAGHGEEIRQKVFNIFNLLQQYKGDIEKYVN
jgi:tripartite-type tricarboxylate transporter receptor subunit TctC